MALGKRRLAALGLALGLGLAMSGCLQSDDDGGGDDGGASNEKSGDKKVTILGAFGGDEQANFEASLEDFESESGIDIEYTADQDFTTTIVQKVNSGQAPDIGLFPQPGGLLDLTDDEVPLEDVIDLDAIEETLIPGFLEAATGEDGKVYGAPMRMAVKSIVWYPKPAYTDAGYPDRGGHLPGPADPVAADRRLRHPAVVHGLGVRPGHRLGRHRLARGDGPPHRRARTSTTSGSSTRSRSTTRPSSRRSTPSVRSPRTRTSCSAASRPSSTPASPTR